MSIVIRRAILEDIPSVVDIRISGWKTAYKDIIDNNYLNSLDRESNIKAWSNNYLKDELIVALKEEKIVGFCRYSYNSDISGIDSEVVALYIEPTLKYQGIGSEIFRYVINDLVNNKKSSMCLWCLRDNISSIKFYEKMGGKLISEKSQNIGGKEYKEVLYLYDLKHIHN